MSRHYFIQDALGSRRVTENELPLCVGGTAQGGIALPGVPDDYLAAYIALSDSHAYVQVAEGQSHQEQTIVYLNDEQLAGSAWLKSGDILQAGRARLRWRVQGDKVLIDTWLSPENDVLHPPVKPRLEATGAVTDEMPVPAAEISADRDRSSLRKWVFMLAGLLLLAAAYLVLASSVVITIKPEPRKLSLDGFPPAVNLWGSWLALPGRYTINASREGFKPLHEQVDITFNGAVALDYSLVELPGLVQPVTSPSVHTKLLVDGVVTPLDAGGRARVSRGDHQLRVETERYLPHEQLFVVDGYGQVQQLAIDLRPAWALIEISSVPAGATIHIDDEIAGRTPAAIEILQGIHQLKLSAPDFKTQTHTLSVEAGVDQVQEPYELQPEDGTLSISSRPTGSSISLNGVFMGVTPLALPVTANTSHQLSISKSGFKVHLEEVRLAPTEKLPLDVELTAEYGTVFLSIFPEDAELRIDGTHATIRDGRLRLSSRPHQLSISKPGYVTYQSEVTPLAGISQNLEVKLEKKQQAPTHKKRNATPTSVMTVAGQSLQLIKPDATLKMGASRREAGRRANESRRLVKFLRPFYIAHKEVTNREYRLFQPAHNSGMFDGAGLNAEQQPVVNISWNDAARFCNWLSTQQGLPPAYREQNGELVAIEPVTTGYRLPTEAEWAWTARRQGQDTEQRYPWAGTYPPQQVLGNYADTRIADTLADVVPGYDDGFRGTAPVGSFRDTPRGFYDLGGNVSEWMHDFYALHPGEATRLVIDPTGPASGEHRVVRGASWRHGNITELRLSYRDYSNKPRPDLGFRLARYVE